MSKSNDTGKRDEWQRRLDRFESSGSTIADFCRQENVGPHAFYYWSKQLGRSKRKTTERTRESDASCVGPEDAQTLTPGAGEALVHFTWNSRLQFSVPADCLEAIRSVLELASASDEERKASSFQQVIVG